MTTRNQARRLQSIAMKASIDAAMISGSAKRHEDAAAAHARAAMALREIGDEEAAREHDDCATLERTYAEAITAAQSI